MSTAAFSQAASGHARTSSKQSVTLSVRLTLEERDRLEALAGERPVSAYVRSRLFGTGGTRRRSKRRQTPDNAALAQVLAALGRSDLSASMKWIQGSIEGGAVRLNPEESLALRDACADISQMRRDLIMALGLKSR